VSTDLTLGVTIKVCTSSQFDSVRDGNKLSGHRFLRLNLAAPAEVTFSMIANPAPSIPSAGFDCETADDNDPERHQHSDPDLVVWRNGEFVVWGVSCTSNREVSIPEMLAAGEYILDINEFRHADPDTPSPFPEQVCFDITAN
jgi:hypothetical protein